MKEQASQMNIRFEERLAEHIRIARELHDTVLQVFLSASMLLQVAETHPPGDGPAKSMVGEILGLMRSVLEDGRNVVRGLRSWQDETCDLARVFSRLPQELAVQRQVDYRVIAEGRPRQLHTIVRDEAYRIAREAVVNAFRHSRARGIEVDLKYEIGQLQVLVRDDGCGIDPHALANVTAWLYSSKRVLHLRVRPQHAVAAQGITHTNRDQAQRQKSGLVADGPRMSPAVQHGTAASTAIEGAQG